MDHRSRGGTQSAGDGDREAEEVLEAGELGVEELGSAAAAHQDDVVAEGGRALDVDVVAGQS